MKFEKLLDTPVSESVVTGLLILAALIFLAYLYIINAQLRRERREDRQREQDRHSAPQRHGDVVLIQNPADKEHQ